ncbi:MAG: T9SS type A sorting domain-containing protein [FCB group bacterium]|nr:T9SS type A sorting domain-containing protein [FCB group bacterium]
MTQVWVSYPWGNPILIKEMSQKSDTYSLTGPFLITCELEDDGVGITDDDVMELKYYVAGEPDTLTVEVSDILPLGDGIYGGEIFGSFEHGDLIRYWINTVDDDGWQNDNYLQWKTFAVLQPDNPDADILFIRSGGYSSYYTSIFNESGVEYQDWEGANIDEYVLEYGWDAVIMCGNGDLTSSGSYGYGGIPADNFLNPYSEYLNNGGRLFYSDANYRNLGDSSSAVSFIEGTFPYDYMGLDTIFANPADFDTVYYGTGNSVLASYFITDPFVTYVNEDRLPDYMSLHKGEPVLLGENTGEIYGTVIDSAFKMVFYSFEPAFSVPSAQPWNRADLREFLCSLFEFFEITYVSVDSEPSLSIAEFTLYQNYPNPFNPETTISFNLAVNGEVKITVYNIYGQLVETLFDGCENAGQHQLKWNAENSASGIYICKLETPSGNLSRKMLLLK